MEKTEYLPPQPKVLNDFTLCYAGHSYCLSGHSFGPAMRPCYMIHYILEGQGSYHVAGRDYRLHAGQGFLTEPNVSHWYQADKEDPWRYLWVAFDGVYAPEYLRRLGLGGDKLIFSCPNRPELERVVMEMLRHNHSGFTHELALQSLLFEFFSILSLTLPANEDVSPRGGRQADYVRKAQEFISHTYTEGICVGQVADFVGVNRSYLFTLFERELGASPQEYITRFKISRAKELLTTTAYNLEQIARSCGYKSSANFSKSFKTQVGLAPGEYRRKIRSAE